jgi:hypothetical protein
VADGRPEVEVRGHGSQPRQNLGPAKTTVAPRARYDIDGPIRRTEGTPSETTNINIYVRKG